MHVLLPAELKLTEIFAVFPVFPKFCFLYFHQTGTPYSTNIKSEYNFREFFGTVFFRKNFTINPHTPFNRKALFSCFVSSTKSFTAPASRIDYIE
jgi:hypothetical protein